MPRNTGGQVVAVRPGLNAVQKRALTAQVAWLSFPGNSIPDGAEGELTLHDAPRLENYKLKETLDYTHSNNNEAMLLEVTKIHGPLKYTVKRTA